MSFCGNCGKQLADGARFCPGCGTKIVPLEKPAASPAAPPAAQQGGAYGAGQNAPQQSPASFPPPPGIGGQQQPGFGGQQQQPGYGGGQQPPYPYQPPYGGGGAPQPEDLRAMLLTYQGRLNRKPYILYSVGIWFLMLILNVVADVLGDSRSSVALLVAFALYLAVLALCVPSVMLTIRRWHDLGKSGWFTLLSLIPVVNFFVEIYLWAAPGTAGPNAYGEDPLAYRR